MIPSAAGSHAGLKRDHNEDAYVANEQLGLWLVADGVGGHANGEVAASIVRDTIVSNVASGARLVDAIQYAHSAVLDEIRNRNGKSNMGSTVVALIIKGDQYQIAWVGDSRAYLFDGHLTRLTRDHSPVSEMLANGDITAQQAARHPERHVLSQSLGVSEKNEIRPDTIEGTFEPGQQFLLCSDGLSDELDDKAMSRAISGASTPQQQISALIAAALESGGNDNVSAVIVGDVASATDAANDRSASTRPDLEKTQDIGTPSNLRQPRARSHLVLLGIIVIASLLAAIIWIL